MAMVRQPGFGKRLADHAAAIEALLARLLADRTAASRHGDVPARLLAAMRHGALGGGKRLRPFLLIESARLFGATGAGPLRAAAALECVHCYSLIHDDLPAMDDDDLRRGKPTVHKAFGEAAAILAGDSLLTIAFEILSDPATARDAAIRAALALALAKAAGAQGMAGGQMLDLDGEGRKLSRQAILRMQAMKTGALIAYACEAGAVLGRARPADRRRMRRFGEALGRAFQIADDLLDATGEEKALGKRAAKDAARGKPTLVALLGIDKSRQLAQASLEEALSELTAFGSRAGLLAAAARHVVERNR
jgi:farnesyl diphosphate synthase